MVKLRSIDKWSAGYWFIKNIITKPAHLLYYRKIVIHNADRIPDGEPVIFAPNHQNALMDAMVLVLHLKYQLIFLTRADVFKNPLIRRILIFLKMLPVYRIRDGRNSLQKNDEIFDTSVQVLWNSKSPLCLFPEGNHGDKRRIRPLVKGIFRIAFKAQEKYGSKPGVKIIPIGLDYDDYYKFHRSIFVNIGHPIEVSDFWEKYLGEPAVTTNALREKLKEEIRKLMIDIETEEFYDLYMGLRYLYRQKMFASLKLEKDTLANRHTADKKLIEKLDKALINKPETIRKLAVKYNKYSHLKDQLNLRDWVFSKPTYSVALNILYILLAVLSAPVFLIGFLLNAPVFFLPGRFVKKTKDRQMRSTLSWGIAFGSGLIYYPVLFILALYFIPFWWLKIISIPMIPVSGLLAYKIRNLSIKSWIRIRYSRENKNNPDMKKALKLYHEIIKEFDQLAA